MENYKDLPHLRVNKRLIKKLGYKAALLYAELIDEERYYLMTRTIYIDNYFYSTSDNIKKRIGLSPYEQREAIKLLIEADLIVQDNRGNSSKKNPKKQVRFFRIKHENLGGI